MPQNQKGTVLVVSRDLELISTFRKQLEPIGYLFKNALSALDAESVARGADGKLVTVVCDAAGDERSVVKRVINNHQGARVIAYTTDQSSAAAMLQAGAHKSCSPQARFQSFLQEIEAQFKSI